MSPARRGLAIGLRIVAGGVLVALAAWYGATSRSLWTILLASAALSIAMAATKRRYWRAPYEPTRFWLAKRLIGTVISETVLAAILFFLAYGVAAAAGLAKPFESLGSSDLYAALLALAVSLGLFGIINVLEEGRDPIDLALEDLAAAAEGRKDAGDAEDEDLDNGLDDDPLEESPGDLELLRDPADEEARARRGEGPNA